MDVPVFLVCGTNGVNQEHVKAMRTDIMDTIKFFYKKGFWSKHHYTHWLQAAKDMEDPEKLHLWWDSITTGAMFEIEGRTSARLEAMEELVEDEIEMKRMSKRAKRKYSTT